MNTKTIFGASLAAVFAISIMFAFTQDASAGGSKPVSTFLVHDSAILDGFEGFYVMVDTTHKQIVEGHVAVVDTTDTCALGDPSQPDTVSILVGDAVDIATGVNGGEFVELFNSGIATPNGCIFHADINAADLGLPSLTDIVVVKDDAATSGVTVSVTAEVAQDLNGEDED